MGRYPFASRAKAAWNVGRPGFAARTKSCASQTHTPAVFAPTKTAPPRSIATTTGCYSHKSGSKACYFCPGTKHPPTPAGKSSGQQNLRLSKSEQKRQKKAAGAKKKKEAAEKKRQNKAVAAKKKKEAAEKKKAAAAKKKKEGAAKKKAAADKTKQGCRCQAEEGGRRKEEGCQEKGS